jgi:hypothetical protein
MCRLLKRVMVMPQTWSAYVDLVNSNGQRGLIVRVSHDPEANRAELWVHLFLDGQLFAHMSVHPCPPIAARFTGDERQHLALDLEQAQLRLAVQVDETDRAVFGAGSIPLAVTLAWSSEQRRGSNLRGRDEQLVMVNAQVTVGELSVEIQGWGHQHTQLQEVPRFSVPFTYLSLRGDHAGLVGLLAPGIERGFGQLGGEALDISGLAIDAPATERRLRLNTPVQTIEGLLQRTYRYWIPMVGTWRDGSIVMGHLGQACVSGVINDFEGPSL